MEIAVGNFEIPKYHHNGIVYVEGRKGSEYLIKVNNNSDNKIMAVVSVDGLSVLDGKAAGSSSPGYIIEPWQTQDIVGWTKNKRIANAFYFSSVPRSYSSRTGNDDRNVGVIGAMIFEEFDFPLMASNLYMHTTSNMSVPVMTQASLTSYGLSNNTGGVGTGWGKEKEMHLETTQFSKKSLHPDDTLIIYYDDRKGLEKRGVIVPTKYYNPNPFPGFHESVIGVKAPKKY